MEDEEFYELDNRDLPYIYTGEQLLSEKGQLALPMEYVRIHDLKPGNTIHWFYLHEEIILSTEMVQPVEEGIIIIGYPEEFDLENAFGTVELSSLDYLFTIPPFIREELGLKPNDSVMVVANEKSVYIQTVPSNFTLEEIVRYRNLLRARNIEVDWLNDDVYLKGFHPSQDQLDSLMLHSKYILATNAEGPFGNTVTFFDAQGLSVGVFPNSEEELAKKWSSVVLKGIPKEQTFEAFKDLVRDCPEDVLFHKKSYCNSAHSLYAHIVVKILYNQKYSHLGTSELYYDA